MSADMEPPLQERDHERLAKRATLAGGVGTFIEFYDFSLYGYLSITIAPLFFPSDNPTTSLLATLAVFGTAYVVRPLGGVLFGHIGDSRGRRTALIATIVTMGVGSMLMALLPTHAQIGAAAGVLLVLLRMLQGLSAGGELGGATTLIAEHVPPRRRAMYAAAPAMGGSLGFAAASGTVAIMMTLTTDEQMVDWGWRITFLLSIPLTLLALWARRRVPESAVAEPSKDGEKTRRLPILEVVRKQPRGLVVTACLSLVNAGTTYVSVTYLSIHLIKVHGYPSTYVYWATMTVAVMSAIFAPLCGAWADRVGIKRVLWIGLLGYLVIAYPVLAVMAWGNTAVTFIAFLLFGLMNPLIAVAMFALVPRYFDREVRYSGVALGCNLGVIIAGMGPFIATWLVATTGSANSPAIFVIAMVLIAAASLLAAPPRDEMGAAEQTSLTEGADIPGQIAR
jgi:MHS family proline/betaine transporter-like MFS transporter